MVRPSLLGDLRRRACPGCGHQLTIWVEDTPDERLEQWHDYYGEEPITECTRCLYDLLRGKP